MLGIGLYCSLDNLSGEIPAVLSIFTIHMGNQNTCKTNIQTLRLNLAMGAYMGIYGKMVQCSLEQFKQCILFER